MRHIDDIKKDWSKELMPEGNRLINLSTGEEERMQPIKKYYACEVKDFSESDKSFTAIASTESVDRDGDILRANGWKLKNFRKNPVFLFGHDMHSLPIGKSLETWVENAKLMFRPKFATDISPFAEMVWKMYKGKFLRSFSVRFDPIDSEKRELTEEEKKRFASMFYTPQIYKSQELLEISAVTIPSNTDATKSKEMMDFIVKSYYAENQQVFPGFDFGKQVWNGTDFIKEKVCTGCKDKKEDFTEELKEKYDKIEQLKRDKEKKAVGMSLDSIISDLEKELLDDSEEKQLEKDKKVFEKQLKELHGGITALAKKREE